MQLGREEIIEKLIYLNISINLMEMMKISLSWRMQDSTMHMLNLEYIQHLIHQHLLCRLNSHSRVVVAQLKKPVISSVKFLISTER